MKLQDAVRTVLDELGDLVAVPGPVFNQRQDQHFGAASFDFLVDHIDCLDM